MARIKRINVWCDMDPGHDDALAILLALHLPNIILRGISTVHGNAPISFLTQNAAKILYSFSNPERASTIPIIEGAAGPMMKDESNEYYLGDDGLAGVEGLLDLTDPRIKKKFQEAKNSIAVEAIAKALTESITESEDPFVILATGSMSNIANFVNVYPKLVPKVKIIVMGGAISVPGNVTSTAEFNIAADEIAASIVFNANCEVVVIPLDLTHTTIFTKEIHRRLLDPDSTPSDGELPLATTPLRHTLSTLMTYFTDAYAKGGFLDGPPVHDLLTVIYVSHPELFEGTRRRIEVETASQFNNGKTSIANFKSQLDETTPASWGRHGLNCLVLESLQTEAFWDIFLDTVKLADLDSPLNKKD